MNRAKCCFNCRNSHFSLPDYNGYVGECFLEIAFEGDDRNHGFTVVPDGICDEWKADCPYDDDEDDMPDLILPE